MGERPGRVEARDAWNGRVRSNVEEHLVCGQQARSAICIEAHLERFRRQELPGAHDQLGATGLEALQMQGDLTRDHVALALADLCHIDPHATRRGAALRSMMRKLCHLRTPDLVLVGQARDVGTGAADPSPLHDGGSPPRAGQMPRQQLAPISTAEDQSVEPLCLGHFPPPCTDSEWVVSTQTHPSKDGFISLALIRALLRRFREPEGSSNSIAKSLRTVSIEGP